MEKLIVKGLVEQFNYYFSFSYYYFSYGFLFYKKRNPFYNEFGPYAYTALAL